LEVFMVYDKQVHGFAAKAGRPGGWRTDGRGLARVSAMPWRLLRAMAAFALVLVVGLPFMLWAWVTDPQDKKDPWRGPE